jgi:hypothetical protein
VEISHIYAKISSEPGTFFRGSCRKSQTSPGRVPEKSPFGQLSYFAVSFSQISDANFG